MAENIEVNVGNVLTPVVIADKNGTKVGAAFINTNDIRVPVRITDILNYMKSIDVDSAEYDALLKFDKALEDKFCYLFGYDCRRSLFGIVSPTTPCGGKFAAVLILEKVMECLSNEVKKKAAERMEKINQYVQPHQK